MKNKWHHKLTMAVCALALLLSLAACGGGQADPTLQTPGTPAETSKPEPSKQDPAKQDTPMTLGQLVKADGVHIFYWTYAGNLAKDKAPETLLVFEDGKLAVQDKNIKTFGELSKMTDKEIAEEVYASPDAVLDSPYFVYVKTDSSGNYVSGEYIYYCKQSVGQLKTDTISIGKYNAVGEVYESSYIGYLDNDYTLYTRGEVYGRDDVSSAYVEVDPDVDEVAKQYMPDKAKAQLADGTIVEAPEDGSFFAVHTYSGGRTLGAEDIQYTQDFYDRGTLDISPFATEDLFVQEYGIDVYAGEGLDYSSYTLAPDGWACWATPCNVYYRQNLSSESVPMDQAEAIVVHYGTGEMLPVNIPAGTIGSLGDLRALYGEPHGSIIQWNEGYKSVRVIHDYWKGEYNGVGFYILCEASDYDYPVWEYVRDCDPGLALFNSGEDLDRERALLEKAP